MSWVADDGSRTTVPFGVNQIQYEIIAPIVSNLLKDTRKERIEIYNHIKDQKLSYLNKWHQDTEDFYGRNRAEAADIINLMRSTLSEYSAAYNTLAAYKKTEETMKTEQSLEAAVTEAQDNSAEVLAGYQAQAQQVTQTQQEFSDYMDRLHEDIDARAEKFGYVEYYDASLRDKKQEIQLSQQTMLTFLTIVVNRWLKSILSWPRIQNFRRSPALRRRPMSMQAST